MVENADNIRLIIFCSLCIGLCLFECLVPKRQWRTRSRISASLTNLLLVVLGTVVIKLLVPVSLVALTSENTDFGLFHIVVFPFWLEFLVSIVLLDCIIYWQHRIFHKVPMLWRIHRVHHSDLSMGTTTAVRFHPVELVLSYLLKLVFVLMLGIDPVAIIAFEILLNAASLWSHSNIRVAERLDSLLRLVFITPDMHRVHHSVYRYEHDSNYGFCLSIWDRIFMSYTPQPTHGHEYMRIGLDCFRTHSDQTFWRLLIQPLRTPAK